MMRNAVENTVKNVFFFFKQKTAYEITHSDWSSDVCSSDLSGGIQSNSESRNRLPALLLSEWESDVSAVSNLNRRTCRRPGVAGGSERSRGVGCRADLAATAFAVCAGALLRLSRRAGGDTAVVEADVGPEPLDSVTTGLGGC